MHFLIFFASLAINVWSDVSVTTAGSVEHQSLSCKF